MSHRHARDSSRPSMPTGIDEIDLTLSSPSPEPQSRTQQRPHTHRGSRPIQTPSNRSTHIKGERHASRTSAQRQPPAPPAVRISPKDMEAIINTSDPVALRAVLLNLCSYSPAFSGALARGLAQHSRYAQNLMQQQQHQSRPASTNNHWERSHLVNNNLTRFGSGNIKREGQISLLEDGDSSVLASSPIVPSFVKPEHNTSPSRSSSSSDTTFSEPLRRPNPPPRSGIPGAFPVSPEPRFKQSLSTTKSSLRLCTCTRCRQPFTEGDVTKCFYHTGRKMTKMNAAGVLETLYSCCDGPSWNTGCEMADRHTGPTASAFDSLKRPRQSTGSSIIMSPPPKNPKFY
jgi:hypothetical protein